MTYEQIAELNLRDAIDQADHYDHSPEWREGDAYRGNVIDTALAAGLSRDDAQRASDLFTTMAAAAGVRFA